MGVQGVVFEVTVVGHVTSKYGVHYCVILVSCCYLPLSHFCITLTVGMNRRVNIDLSILELINSQLCHMMVPRRSREILAIKQLFSLYSCANLSSCHLGLIFTMIICFLGGIWVWST
jgi:hypothetical protein